MSNSQVFISYSHHDREKAEKLAWSLQGHGFTVWWDHDLLAGDDFRKVIAEKIRDARVVLVLFSENSIESRWVLDEAGRADNANKLVPVLISEVDVPLGFGQLHRCDLVEWKHKGDDAHSHKLVDQVLLAVERHTGTERASVFTEPDFAKNHEHKLKKVEHSHADRFSVGWWPDENIRHVLGSIALLYLLALFVALYMADNIDTALWEWVRLLHVYSGMITLAGGIFLSLVFRFSDKGLTPLERGAVVIDVARPLFGGWRIAALAQLATGLILTWMRPAVMAGWVVQSLIFYLFALYLWWVGFDHGLRAGRYDALYRKGEHIRDARRMRDQRLLLAIILTAWVLVTMIYREDADLLNLMESLIKSGQAL